MGTIDGPNHRGPNFKRLVAHRASQIILEESKSQYPDYSEDGAVINHISNRSNLQEDIRDAHDFVVSICLLMREQFNSPFHTDEEAATSILEGMEYEQRKSKKL